MIAVLFVCLGNICRSPAAEGVFNSMVRKASLQNSVRADSAGVSGAHVGELPDPRMREAARKRGVLLSSRARQFHSRDFADYHSVVAMDRSVYAALLAMAPTPPRKTQNPPLYTLCQFSAYSSFDVLDVPDPYYGSQEDFEYVLDIVEDGSARFLEYIAHECL